MKKALTLYSSARPNGNTFQLVNTFNQLMPSELCYLDNLNIAQYDYHHKNQDDDFARIIDKMLSVDVIILASPVYWYSLTPTMRRFFDRFTDLMELPALKPKGQQLREKLFYLFATSSHAEPPVSFTAPVINTLKYLGWSFSGTVHVNCKKGFDSASAEAALKPIAHEAKSMDKDGMERTGADALTQGSMARLMSQFK